MCFKRSASTLPLSVLIDIISESFTSKSNIWMPPGQKNKRGARGSVEEEKSAAKRSNMADAGETETRKDDTSPSEEEEPNLYEIKTMLVDIQISVSSILLDNKQLKKELAELKASLQIKDQELRDLKTTFAKASKANIEMAKSLKATTTSLDVAKRDLQKQNEEIEFLNESLDNLEQYTRKNSLEFHGVPENSYASTEEAVLKIAAALDVQVAPNDIEISHQLRRKKGNNAIIAKFCSHKVKTSLYKARIKLKNIKASDLFPSASYAAVAGSTDRLFINENLTSYRRGLVDSANKKRRDGYIISVWTMDGKVFVKTSPDGNPVRIFTEEDLDTL